MQQENAPAKQQIQHAHQFLIYHRVLSWEALKNDKTTISVLCCTAMPNTHAVLCTHAAAKAPEQSKRCLQHVGSSASCCCQRLKAGSKSPQIKQLSKRSHQADNSTNKMKSHTQAVAFP